ncbi:hypothetical protein ACX9I7_32410 [Streptomyces sp. L500]
MTFHAYQPYHQDDFSFHDDLTGVDEATAALIHHQQPPTAADRVDPAPLHALGQGLVDTTDHGNPPAHTEGGCARRRSRRCGSAPRRSTLR